MDAEIYQELAARTLIDKPGFKISDDDIMIIWNAIGLAGEAGEVCEAIKKGIFHQHGLDRGSLQKELGDVCWYLAALCTKLGLDLGEVMSANIEKLKARYPDGYSSNNSKRRVDIAEQELRQLYGGFDEIPAA
jgi:NTP pyrophosphatase (non-canonical NTP hydrolase)